MIRLEGRTPLIYFELPATRVGSTDTVVMYGHLDKQPEFNGWRRQWALAEHRTLGQAGKRRRQKRRWPDLG